MARTIKHDDVERIDDKEFDELPRYNEPTEAQKDLTQFVVEHTDRWREYRDQNYKEEWERYERIFRGKFAETDKTRASERSKIISPATQQAVETRHAEIMEAIFGNGEFFDIRDDLNDQTGPMDVEKLKLQLQEDFEQDKIRKSIDQIVLLAEIFGTGIGEIVVSEEKKYYPDERVVSQLGSMQQVAYGVSEKDRVCVKLVPVNPKNFLFDPNGTEIDDCMGVAVEKYVSVHKIMQGIADGKYFDVDITTIHESDDLEQTQEKTSYRDDKVLLMTYYGLVPSEYLDGEEEESGEEESELGDDLDDYADMVEAIVVVANGGILLKAEKSPYMMKDRPVVSYQDDTVPNRLLGRGTVEKSFNMQSAIDGSMRSHMDALALTNAPMIAADATRLPRGAKFEVRPGKMLLSNGAPNDIFMPFKFGTNDGQAMTTAKEFERMLLMATGTIDSNNQVSQTARDGQMDMATATIIKKYKRTLTNFQEDFLIPFIRKAAWRYMQFDPERYPATDVKFIPTAALGIIAREYEQKQLAFMAQTLGANSSVTPVIMAKIVENSSLPDRMGFAQQIMQAAQPNPQAEQAQQTAAMADMRVKDAEAKLKEAQAEKARVEAQLAPDEMKSRIIAAVSRNLDDDQEGKDFERRMKIADLLLREKDIDSNERIAKMQIAAKKKADDDYVSTVNSALQ